MAELGLSTEEVYIYIYMIYHAYKLFYIAVNVYMGKG